MGINNSMERFLATLDAFLVNNAARLQARNTPSVYGRYGKGSSHGLVLASVSFCE